MDRNELIKRGNSLKPSVMIGKGGITENAENEIRTQLEKRELIKIKMLPSMGPSAGWKESIEGLAARSKATLIQIKGGTVLLYKRSSKKRTDRK